MTFERKFVVGFDDMKSVSLECNRCKIRLTYSPDQTIKVPEVCPNIGCNSVWSPRPDRAFNDPQRPSAVKFLLMLKGLLEEQKEENSDGFQVLLEFEEPR
jgi:hypothetical protein